MSNALKPQRKTSITGLTPATHYVVKLEAHNIAGFSSEEFQFMTLTKEGGNKIQNQYKVKHSQNKISQKMTSANS